MDVMTQRYLTEETTAEEVFGFHRADRPDCPAPALSLLRDGIGCSICRWVMIDMDGRG